MAVDANIENRSKDRHPPDKSEKLHADSEVKTLPTDTKRNSQNDTAALVGKGTLPPVDLEHPKKEWTLAIELGATLPGDKQNPAGFGAESKLDQLKGLAKSTEGKSVNMLVEVERTTDPHGGVCHAPGKSADKTEKCDQSATEKGNAKTERYFIHDGKIDRLPDSKAKNPQDEIKQLLTDARKMSPSNKLGLIVQSHGMGVDGIHTNKGDLSLNKTLDAIKQGLKGGDHSKLDVLDFDACSMGTLPVMDKMAKVSNNVVASASEEGAGQKSGTRTNDGQNLNSAIHKLIDNPGLSGKDFADSLVNQAKQGENGVGKADTTLTLANFDMTKYQDFKQSMDTFGQQLTRAASNQENSKENLKSIKAAVNASTSPDTGKDDIQAHERDLKSFGENILNEIHAGHLKGDPALEQSAKDFLKNLDAFDENHFGEKARGFENLGGLTTNLPGSELTDKKTIGQLASPLHQFSNELGKIVNSGPTFADKGNVGKALEPALHELSDQLAGGPGNPAPQIKQALQKVLAAKSESEFQSSMNNMQAVLARAEKSKLGQELAHDSEGAARGLRADYRHSKPPAVSPGWDSFIHKLESSTS